jgi:hypothetical protein
MNTWQHHSLILDRLLKLFYPPLHELFSLSKKLPRQLEVLDGESGFAVGKHGAAGKGVVYLELEDEWRAAIVGVGVELAGAEKGLEKKANLS